ncbi:MAG TPA: S26 family signal peptidase [Thermoplasmata archaeon]|nr:S26 family signal peptidase [Thermoplasmata archaeon]
MPHPRSSRAYDDEDEPEEPEDEEDEEEEEPAPRRRPRPPVRRGHRRARPPPVRRWRASAEDEEEEEEEEGGGAPPPLPWKKKPIYWRARDSLFFEPLVALAIIVILIVSLYAYTQNWPPIYVVESNSMQHGSADQLGLINAGDLVLAQKIPISQITTYVVGLRTGYSTYGEHGDVLLYWPNGQGGTPVIHRALLYLEWDPAGFYNATDLSAALPCGSAPNATWAYFASPGSPASCATNHLNGILDLYHVGWNSQTVSLDLTPSDAPSTLGDHSGFVTMGDNNSVPDQAAPSISSLVAPGWVIGVARGMIPWFGSIKLLLDGDAGKVPTQSWELMALTIVGIILAAFGLHYALRREGIETPLRRQEEDEARAEAEAEAPAEPSESTLRRWLSHLRLRHRDEEEETEDESESRRRRSRPPTSRSTGSRGRPVPHVRRGEKPKRRRPSDDSDEL